MTVAELIEKLKSMPDQAAPVIYTYAGEVTGDVEIQEISEVTTRPLAKSYGLLRDAWPPTYPAVLTAVELV